MKKIILFNGPPRTGKDTIVNALKTTFPNIIHEKFAAPLKKMIEAVYGHYNDDLKDEPLYFGYTGRQLLIRFCEEFLKPMHGRDVIGKLTLERVRQYSEDKIIVFSDLGFVEEYQALADHYPCHIIHVVRDGFTFKNDSRTYIQNGKVHVLHNYSLVDFIHDGIKLVDRIISHDTQT